MSKSVTVLDTGRIAVSVVGPEFTRLLAKVKAIPNRKYDRTLKLWTLPNTVLSLKNLTELGFDVSAVPARHDKKISIAGSDTRLYDFQKEGLRKIIEFDGRCLLSMDQGLGKTCTSLQLPRIRQEDRPTIIVCPASVKMHWLRELRVWCENTEDGNIVDGFVEKPIVMFGQKQMYVKGFTVIIINYDILSYHVDYLCSIKPKILIADEVQFVKNMGSSRAKALRKLAKATPRMLGLSGTPIMNRPAEFYSILNMLKPDIWGAKTNFLYRYCAPKQTGFGWTYNGATNTKELNQTLNDEVMFRVLKKDVLTQLPDKAYSVVPFKIDNMSKYRMLESGLTSLLSSGKKIGPAILQRLAGMRDEAVDQKLDQAMTWMDNFLTSGEKLVVFAVHVRIVEAVKARYGDAAVMFYGKTSVDKRERAIQRFRSDPKVRVFVGNVEAAGTGIDGLQDASSNVAFLELPWVPTQVDQASDRLHRIGQKDMVNVYYLIAQGTIEERMASVIDAKRKVITAVLDGTEVAEMSLITELLKKYR